MDDVLRIIVQKKLLFAKIINRTELSALRRVYLVIYYLEDIHRKERQETQRSGKEPLRNLCATLCPLR